MADQKNKTPDGFLFNGRLAVSVAGNNLTLALKTFAGTDPSLTDAVFVSIGGVIRTISAALSVTKNAATNWCNAGSAEWATQELDYYAYLGYNATDGVTIGFSRISYATLYSDFSTTSTNEKYAGISTITNAAGGDNYVNVGRFAATLSAGAGYTWTVPTFTTANLIQRPIFETRELTWVPAFTNLTVGNATLTAKAQFKSNRCLYHVELVWGNTTSIAGSVSHTLPFARGAGYPVQSNPLVPARLFDATASPAFSGVAVMGTTAATLVAQNAAGTYLQFTLLTNLIPFTWTTSDEIEYQVEYFI